MLALGSSVTPNNADAELQAYMRKYSVPGISICYQRGREVLYSAGFGVSDEVSGAPVTPASLFRIASNSKAFTAAAIFLLIQAGRLKLEDTVFSPQGILSQYANSGNQKDWLHSITVHQLLTHTCGGWSNESDDPMMEQPGFDHQRLIAWTIQTHPLVNPPGQHYAYSNFGYCVLGRVIEQVSGQPYAQFVRQSVLRVVGANDMRIATHRPAPNEVTYYGQNGEQPYKPPITRMDSHGGWIATSHDMATFLASLFAPADGSDAPALLSRESLTSMTTGSDANHGYGCGLAINRAGNAWHFGSLPGTLSLMVHTHTGYSWAAVMNTRSPIKDQASDLDRMMWRIARTDTTWQV
ncbi:serine hydrolase domain-containing protein [Terriglobus albidus]|uniref:serine hydrolase domain-containing protein n=1 Tax=Terriglobus albidus TaxID=1592106 RepID=UPI0021E08E6B|nr:serine hydrolase domain-containing protein [Terriglobus albidus]